MEFAQIELGYIRGAGNAPMQQTKSTTASSRCREVTFFHFPSAGFLPSFLPFECRQTALALTSLGEKASLFVGEEESALASEISEEGEEGECECECEFEEVARENWRKKNFSPFSKTITFYLERVQRTFKFIYLEKRLSNFAFTLSLSSSSSLLEVVRVARAGEEIKGKQQVVLCGVS